MDSTTTEERKPFLFQGTWCAFALWETILFISDIFMDVQEPKAFWGPLYAGHAALAGLLFIMTLQKGDINSIPLLSMLTPFMMSFQDGIAKRCPCLQGQTFCTMASMYFGIGAFTRIASSGFPHPWLALTILNAVMHPINLLCIICMSCCCKGSRRESTEKKDK
mmetsp:Transcript_55349/g.177503  ORF Transcript_55349/g.177503 Transcript_55349/m.177503 type:complete len:164 (-) Transcript_55349:284-775(-)